MSVFKTASRSKTRVQTTRGLLSAEQLWDLPIDELDKLAVTLEDDLQKSGRKSFLKKQSPKDEIAELKFNLVREILESKVAESEKAQADQAKKQSNERILTLIQNKKEKALESLTVEELEKLLS